jgi:hypothetical protein
MLALHLPGDAARLHQTDAKPSTLLSEADEHVVAYRSALPRKQDFRATTDMKSGGWGSDNRR